VEYESAEIREGAQEPDVAALERACKLHGSDAISEFERLVEMGSVFSMIYLAEQYRLRDVEYGGPDLSAAQYWFGRAVEVGSSIATLHLGYLYLHQKDYMAAYHAFKTGADRSYAPSMVRLADLHIHGLGVGRDLARAKSLLEQADQLGNLWASRTLGIWDMNNGKSICVRAKGLIKYALASYRFRIETKRNPASERIKK
jgi:TPR repeat protein